MHAAELASRTLNAEWQFRAVANTLPADGSSADACVHLTNGMLSLDPQCWLGLSQPARTTFVAALQTYLQPSGYTVYIVQQGDSLSSVASHLGLTLDQLVAVNGGSSQLVILVGMPLLIPAPAG